MDQLRHLHQSLDLLAWSNNISINESTYLICSTSSSQSPKKVGEDIQKATLEWKGIKVMVRLSVINRVVRLITVEE